VPFVIGAVSDENPYKCNCPVDSCGNQFKNWLQPQFNRVLSSAPSKRHPSGCPLPLAQCRTRTAPNAIIRWTVAATSSKTGCNHNLIESCHPHQRKTPSHKAWGQTVYKLHVYSTNSAFVQNQMSSHLDTAAQISSIVPHRFSASRS